MLRIFFREVVYLNEEIDNSKIYKNKKDKLPYAVFISPINKEQGNSQDYKEIFTDIISDRIKEKYK